MSKRQWIGIIVYSLVFPLTQIIGGASLMLGVILTAPFLSIGYIFGMSLLSAFGGGDVVYVGGVTLSTLAQVFLIVYVFNKLAANREKNT